MCFDILNAVYYGKQMQQHAPSWNSFVEVNRTGDRKSFEILFANTHQTVDNPRVTQKDKTSSQDFLYNFYTNCFLKIIFTHYFHLSVYE